MSTDRKSQDVAETDIRGQDHKVPGFRILGDFAVGVTSKTNIAHIVDFKTRGAQSPRQRSG